MEVDNPKYTVNETTDFNINFMKQNETGLTLSKAKKTFVQLTGFNVIYAYNFLKSLLYSENTIASNILSTQTIVANEIVCNKIICKDEIINMTACLITFNNITTDLTSSSHKINRYGKSDTIENLEIPTVFNIVVNPYHIILIYDNKRIVDKIQTTDKKIFKNISVKNFTHITVKQILTK